MIAVITTGGKQYKVAEGDILKIEKLEGEVNTEVSFDEVLLRSDAEGTAIELGAPYLAGVQIKGTIVEQCRDKKIDIIKYKPKVRYRRKNGHRQLFTKVKIGAIK